ncbi:MAG: hypothetical protein ACKOXT_04350 [Actinomycetota bacterium]
MKNSIAQVATITAILLSAAGISIPAQAEAPEALPNVVSVQAPKIFQTKAAAGKPASQTSNLTYHGGPVMTNPVQITPIYWGQKWNDATFASDKVSGLATLYRDYDNSAHAGISTQYYQGSSLSPIYTSKRVSLFTEKIDKTTTASSKTADVLNEVVKVVGFDSLSNDGYYPVYTDLPRGTAGYCAWHSAGTVSSNGQSKVIKFAFFFSLDGDGGCDPSDSQTVYTQGTEALANVSIHELAEAMTDPQLNAWYDKTGYENADKCAWKFTNAGVTLGSSGYAWRIQGEWDNKTASCKW